MALVSMGWHTTRARLSRREVFALVSVALVYAGIGALKSRCLADATACAGYLLSEYVVRAMLMLFTIIATNFQLTSLRNQLLDASWAPSTPMAYAWAHALQQFRWAFLAYLLVPPLLVAARVSLLTWQFDWMGTLLGETVVVWAYVAIGLAFRPRSQWPHEILAASLAESEQARQAQLQRGLASSDGVGSTAAAPGPSSHLPGSASPARATRRPSDGRGLLASFRRQALAQAASAADHIFGASVSPSGGGSGHQPPAGMLRSSSSDAAAGDGSGSPSWTTFTGFRRLRQNSSGSTPATDVASTGDRVSAAGLPIGGSMPPAMHSLPPAGLPVDARRRRRPSGAGVTGASV